MKLPLPLRLALLTIGIVGAIALELLLAVAAALFAVLLVTAWVI